MMSVTNVIVLLWVTAYQASSLAPPRILPGIRTTASAHGGRINGALQMGFFDELLKVGSTSPKVTLPPGFEPPMPRPLALPESANLGDILRSGAALVVRLATGAFVLGWKIDDAFAPEDGNYALAIGPFRIRDSSSVLQDAPRPAKPLILYEYAASPFCKRVRETINLLDLTVEYRPCPGARAGFAEELLKRSGRRTVPYLVDPNTGTEMFESSDQIEYLLSNYGPPSESFDRKALWPITFEAFSINTSVIAALLQGMPGSRQQPNARPDNTKMRPLELWGYESSPFVASVREKLCTLGLPHVYVSCSRGSVNRNLMVERTGRFQVPFLVDPNTGIEMFESAAMAKYLEDVYTTQR